MGVALDVQGVFQDPGNQGCAGRGRGAVGGSVVRNKAMIHDIVNNRHKSLNTGKKI